MLQPMFRCPLTLFDLQVVACRVVRRLTKYTTDGSAEFFGYVYSVTLWRFVRLSNSTSSTHASTLAFTARSSRFTSHITVSGDEKKLDSIHVPVCASLVLTPNELSVTDAYRRWTSSRLLREKLRPRTSRPCTSTQRDGASSARTRSIWRRSLRWKSTNNARTRRNIDS